VSGRRSEGTRKSNKLTQCPNFGKVGKFAASFEHLKTTSRLLDAIPTNAIRTKIHVERHIITLYIHIHQRVTISRVT